MFKIEKKDSLQNYLLLKKLGKGSYGTVYLAKQKNTNQKFVIKKIDVSKYKTSKQKQTLHNEASLLQKLNHPRIIKIYSSFMTNDKLYLVMEYASNGDLYQYIKNQKQKKIQLSEKQIWKISIQIFEALQCIHNQNIVHRDIKPQNIFLDKNFDIKVGDFGVSKILETFKKNEYTKVGTPLYISPELVQNKKYDYKVDIWSAGCVLYYLVAQRVPFRSENLLTLSNLIVYKTPKCLDNISNHLQNFIFQCLNKKSIQRPDSSLCLQICQKQGQIEFDKENLNVQINKTLSQIPQLFSKKNQILLSDLKKLKQQKFQYIQSKENPQKLTNIIKVKNNQKKENQIRKNVKKNRVLSASASKLLKKINYRNSNLKFKVIQNFPNTQSSLQRIQSSNKLQCFKVNHTKNKQIKSLQNFNNKISQTKDIQGKQNPNFLSFYFQNYLFQSTKQNDNFINKKQRPNTAIMNIDNQQQFLSDNKIIQRPQSALKINQNFRIC